MANNHRFVDLFPHLNLAGRTFRGRRIHSIPNPMATCSVCDYPTQPFVSDGLRCACCFRMSENAISDHLANTSFISCTLEQCWIHQVDYAREICTCLCTCGDDDSSDSDYAPESETESLSGNEYNIDPQHIRRYGLQKNATLTNAQSGLDRSLWVESQLHHNAATQHTADPAESSLPNRHNQITNVEFIRLARPLEPWEAEALHHANGASWDEIRQVFPESSSWLPSPAPVVQPGPFDDTHCQYCYRFLSPDVRRLIQARRIRLCRNCYSIIRPDWQLDDPDWDYLNVNLVADGIRYCYCRCTCDTPVPLHILDPRRGQQNQPTTPNQAFPPMQPNNQVPHAPVLTHPPSPPAIPQGREPQRPSSNDDDLPDYQTPSSSSDDNDPWYRERANAYMREANAALFDGRTADAIRWVFAALREDEYRFVDAHDIWYEWAREQNGRSPGAEPSTDVSP